MKKITLLVLLWASLAASASSVVPIAARAVDENFPRAVSKQLAGESPDLAADTSFTIVACGSYTWNGTTYTESGDYTYSHPDDNDSTQVDTLHLTINHPLHTAATVTASGRYSWNGSDYYFTNDYLYSHADANGCEQVDTLHLTIVNPYENIVEYWFDQRYSNRIVATLDVSSWQTQIDVSALDIGLHTLYMHLRDSAGHCSPPRTALFYKVFEVNPAGAFNTDYTCWFDQNNASRQTISFANGGTLVDVSQLPVGLHTLNIQIGDGADAELHCYIFYKASYGSATTLGIDYTCWFDQNYASRQTIASANGSTLVDVNPLPDGLHTLNLLIGSGADAELHSYLFYKTSYGATGAFNMTGTCWFDQNNSLQQTITFADGITFVDVSQLSDGLHTLNIQFGSGNDAELHVFLFYKASYGGAGGYSMDYTCWFDQNYDYRLSGTLTNGILPLDVDTLTDGLHTLNILIGSGAAAELRSYLFYKVSYDGPAGYSTDYTCWFDQNHDGRQSGTLTNGTLLLEMDGLTDGLHVLNMQIGSGTSADLHSYVFYCMPHPSELTDSSTLFYHYAIDGYQRPTLQVSPQNRMIHLDLDVADLSTGLHSLEGCLMTGSGNSMALHQAFFYVQPAGGEGLWRYEYWFNNDFYNRTVVDVDPVVDTLQVLLQLQVDSLPFNTRNFQFDPNGGNPILFFADSITFRFWNNALRITSASRQYFNQRMLSSMFIDTIERNTTKYIDNPGSGQIHWFQLTAGVGDSLSFRTGRRCTMQLYAPSGAMVMHASADSVLTWNGCRLWECGVFYLAVHDAEGSGDLAVSYQHLANESTVFTVTACGSYTWLDSTYTESGTYVRTVPSNSDCDNVVTLVLTVKPLPNLTIIGNNSFCQNDNLTLTASGANSYQWSNGSHYAEITLNSPGVYTVTGTGENGCTNTATKTVSIEQTYNVAVTHSICQGESYDFYGQNLTEAGTYTQTLQAVNGCDSTVTLTLVILPSLFSDNFNDEVIDPEKWTYTGNAVLEEEGQLKLQQNITDQEVHLKSMDIKVPASGKVAMDRKFMIHTSNNNHYGRTIFFLNGDNSNPIRIEYCYADYVQRYGTYLVYTLNGNEEYVRLCDATFDTWLFEHLEFDFHEGTFSYYLDTLEATVYIPGLDLLNVDHYAVQFNPYGWWAGHWHNMDWVDIYGESGLVTTGVVSDTTATSATCSGSVSTDICNPFTDSGVCWSTHHYPTTSDAHTTNGSGAGAFTNVMRGLVPNTTYYVRAYATDGTGTAYGEEVSFTTFVGCHTPIDVTVTEVGPTYALLNWAGEGDPISWQICLNDDTTNLITADSNMFMLTGLTNESVYTVKVRAYCDTLGRSLWSEPVTFETTDQWVIGFGNATVATLPTETGHDYSLTQQIYTVEELGAAAAIISIDFYNTSTEKIRNLDVYMVSTEKDAFNSNTDWIPVTEGDKVFSGEVTFSQRAWTTIVLNHPYAYDGLNNVAIIVDDNTGDHQDKAYFRSFTAASNQSIYYYSNSDNYDPTGSMGAATSRTSSKNQIRIHKGECVANVSVSSNNPTYGVCTGSGCYSIGETAILRAIPASHTVFLRWSDNDTTNPRYLVAESDTSLTAIFELFLPELHVASISHSDLIGGETATISWTVRNDGTAPTPNGEVWYDRVWLSLESRVAADDNQPILLGSFPNVSALAPGEYYTQTQTFNLPLTLQGAYFLFVITDAYDAHHIYWEDGEVPVPYNPPAYLGALTAHGPGSRIAEISESYHPDSWHDNFFYELVDIAIPPLPDLVVSPIPPTVQNFFSGRPIDFTWQVRNEGDYDTRVSYWRDVVFVSNSPVFDEATALPIGSTSHYGLLLPDSSYQVTTTVSVPIEMQGTAWFYVYTDYYNQVYEHVGRYNNVTRSDSVNIILTPPADLAPRNITADNTVSTGSTFHFAYEIHNQGAGVPNYGSWLDRCYLSTSADTLVNAVLIAEDWHYNSLESGDFYSISHTVSLPSNMTEGVYYLFVQTDAQNSVFEFDMEGNNMVCTGQPISVSRPDLQIHSLNMEDTLHASAEVGLSYYVANTGGGGVVNQNVTDRVYLSHNPDGVNAMQIAELSHNLWLNPYDSILKMQNVTIPGNLQDGDYYLFVSTNVNHSLNESDLNNNRSPIKHVFVYHLPLPDLLVSAVEMSDTLTVGDTAVIGIHLHNQGDASAQIGNLTWQMNLSIGTQNLACALFGGTAETETLPAGATAYLEKHVFIPPITTQDLASFALTVNHTHGVTESDYSNNGFYFSRAIRPYLFDLKVSQLSSPSETVSGDSITVSWTVENIGEAPSDFWPMYVWNGSSYQQAQGDQLPTPWYDVVYFSHDILLDNSDVEIGRYAHSYALHADSSYSASTTCMVPLFEGGDYYVLVISDATNVTLDSQRANNLRVHPLSVISGTLPDLQLDTLLASDSVVTMDTYKIRYTVSNIGEHITHSNHWTDVLYLNSQPTLHNAQQLGSKIHHGQLGVNASYTDSIQVNIPNMPGGNYYLIGYTDANGQVVETGSDDNNLFILPISVIPCALPDLQMDTMLAADAVTTGNAHQLRYTVSNGGERITHSDRWADAFYFNNQPNLQGAQHIGSKIHYGQLDIDALYTDSISVVIPNTWDGDCYLIGFTDATGQVMEAVSDENNLFVLPVSVSRPLPSDLTVLPPDFPSNVQIGEAMTVSYIVQNVGFNTAKGSIKDAVYLSADSTWSSDDIMLGSVQYNLSLAANGQQERGETFTLQGVPAGNYYVVVKTNILNALNENTYTNNTAVSLSTLTVGYPSLFIGQEEHRTLSSGQTAYYRMDVGPEYEHQTLSCKLSSPLPNVANGLYIAYSTAPTASTFGWSATVPYQQEQEILIPSLNQGTYYIMITGQTSDNASQDVTILASIINFEILSVDANSGANTGSVTTQIIGAKFDTIMDFRLANSNGYLPAEKVFFNNSTESFVTFNLRDQEAGVYDVVAELPGGIITVKGQSFVIEEGLPAELLSNIIAPASVRNGNTFTVTIEYGNNGSTDLNVSGLLLVSTGGFPIAFDSEGLSSNAYGLIFETAEPNGNPDVIRPGYFATKTIFVRATHTGNINLQLFPIRRQY